MFDSCSTCKWIQFDEYGLAWVCVNGDSEYCADFVDAEGSCNKWECRNSG